MKKNNFRELINHYKDCIMLGFAERISKKVFQGNGFPWLNSNGKGCIQAFSLIQWLYDGTNHKRLDILVVIRLEWRIIKILRRCCNSILHFKMIYCLFEVCIPNELMYVFIYMYTKLSYLAKKILFHVVIENNRKFLYQGNSLAHECFLESSIPSRLLSFMGWFEFVVSWSHIPSIWHSSLRKSTYFFFYIIFYFEFRTMLIKSISRVHLSHLYSI